jgi:hypothetical protein
MRPSRGRSATAAAAAAATTTATPATGTAATGAAAGVARRAKERPVGAARQHGTSGERKGEEQFVAHRRTEGAGTLPTDLREQVPARAGTEGAVAYRQQPEEGGEEDQHDEEPNRVTTRRADDDFADAEQQRRCQRQDRGQTEFQDGGVAGHQAARNQLRMNGGIAAAQLTLEIFAAQAAGGRDRIGLQQAGPVRVPAGEMVLGTRDAVNSTGFE